MRTERQKQAARANGAKSHGPHTPEGKLASSRNAMTHGILSGTVVLKGESEERFAALLASLHAELQPQTMVETSLVETMAVARWRQMRIWGLEKATIEHELDQQTEARDSRENDNIHGIDARGEDHATDCAIAFRSLSDDSRSLELINRYESRYDRQYLRAHRRFLELVDRRTPPPAQPPAQSAARPQLVPAAENTNFAKRTRQPVNRAQSYRLAAVACAIILAAFSLNSFASTRVHSWPKFFPLPVPVAAAGAQNLLNESVPSPRTSGQVASW